MSSERSTAAGSGRKCALSFYRSLPCFAIRREFPAKTRPMLRKPLIMARNLSLSNILQIVQLCAFL